jgi:cytoskeletal protein RodZ
MQNKIITLLISFVVLFSLQGFSQTPEKSNHPLLDKYYPQKQNTDTNKTVTTATKPVPETNAAPPVATTPVVTPAVITTTAPAVITTTTVSTSPAAVTATPAVATAPAVNKPDTVTTRLPVQAKVQTQPAPTPQLFDTRLGSSSPLYDTWKKNNNGAGSVTTSPK